MNKVTPEDITAVLSGNADDQLKKTVLEQVHDDPELKKEYIRIKNIFAVSGSLKDLPEEVVNDLFSKIKKPEKRPKSIFHNFRKYFAYAATVLLVAGIYLLYNLLTAEQFGTSVNTVVTMRGQQSGLILPDNSEVFLNYDTKITYDNLFGIKNRKLQLTGQAFFNVSKNKNLEFRIETAKFEVEVKGTTFDVNAYPDNQLLILAVYSGKVQLKLTDKHKHQLQLGPGEMAVLDQSNNKLRKQRFEPEKQKSWKNGVLYFNDTNMKDVLQQLSRKYNLEIDVKNPSIYKSVFTATIKDESFSDVFRLMEYSCNIKCKTEAPDTSDRVAKIIIDNK